MSGPVHDMGKAEARRRQLAERAAGPPRRSGPCGKRDYVSDGEARKALAALRARGSDVRNLTSYLHAGCGAWHLGRKQPREARP